MKDLFSVLEELYRLFNCGHKRHDVLVTKMAQKDKSSKKRRLKRVQTTRWKNKADAFKVIIECYGKIKSALLELQSTNNFEGETITLAKGIMSKLHKYKTIVSPLYVARTAFKVTHHATVVRMQGLVLDHGGVQAIIQNVKAQISNIRKDEEWDKVISKAEEFMKKHDVLDPAPTRIKRRKRCIDELGLE